MTAECLPFDELCRYRVAVQFHIFYSSLLDLICLLSFLGFAFLVLLQSQQPHRAGYEDNAGLLLSYA